MLHGTINGSGVSSLGSFSGAEDGTFDAFSSRVHLGGQNFLYSRAGVDRGGGRSGLADTHARDMKMRNTRTSARARCW